MLIGNRSVLHKSPGRFLSGTVASGDRDNFSKPGMMGNRFQAMSPIFAGIPSGHLSPSAWRMPRTAGALSAINAGTISVTPGLLTLAEGRNIEGASSITLDVPDAALQLVVSATGTATITFTQSANVAGALFAVGSASAAMTSGTPTLGAIINATGGASFAITGSATPRAVGTLAGNITPFTELSPEGLAASLWGAAAASYNVAGTMGAKLNAAGSGGVDLDALAAAVWAYTVRGLTETADADVKYVNGVQITGTGVDGDTWGPA